MPQQNPRALLVYPPVYDFALFDLYLKPYGLMRIGRWLSEGGFDVHVMNALDYRDPDACNVAGFPRRKDDGTGKFHRIPAELPVRLPGISRRYYRYGIPPGLVEERLITLRPDLVLISTGMTYWYPGVREIIRAVDRFCPGTPIAVGGVYATLLPDHCASLGPVDVIPGPVGPGFKGFLRRYGFPVPAGFPGFRVLAEPSAWRDAGVIRLSTGCPLECDYCASRLLAAYSPGDPADLYSGLTELADATGIRDFAFYDDALLLSRDTTFIPFLRRLMADRRSFRFHLPNAVHVTGLDAQVAALMAASGFQEIRLGFESSSEEFHRAHDGKWFGDDFGAAVEALRIAGFPADRIGAYVLVGLPGQEAPEAEGAVRFARSFGIDVILSRYSPIPGTRLWQESVARGRYPLAEEPLYQNNTLFPLEWEGFTASQLEELHRMVVEHRKAIRSA